MDDLHVEALLLSQSHLPSTGRRAATAATDRVAQRSYPEPVDLDELIGRVERVGVSLFRWRALAAELASEDAGKRAAAYGEALLRAEWRPGHAAEFLVGERSHEGAAITKAERMGGTHLTELVEELSIADEYWPAPEGVPAGGQRVGEQLTGAQASLVATLERATQHVAVLLLWRKAQRAPLGVRVGIAEELSRWVLAPGDADKVKSWIAIAPPRFLDVPHRRGVAQLELGIAEVKMQPTRAMSQGAIFGAPTSTRTKWAAVSTILWAPVAAILVLWLAISLLATAGFGGIDPVKFNLHFNEHHAFWELVALFALVAGGAALHLASKSLAAVNFNDGLGIQGKDGRYSDWFAVRWTSLIRVLIPITVVAGVLQVTNASLADVEGISTALLAGFSADSILRSGLDRMAEKGALEDTRRAFEVEQIRADHAALKSRAANAPGAATG